MYLCLSHVIRPAWSAGSDVRQANVAVVTNKNQVFGNMWTPRQVHNTAGARPKSEHYNSSSE